MKSLLRNIKSDISRAVDSRKFAAGAIGVIAVIAFASIGQIPKNAPGQEPKPFENGFHAELILKALQSDAFTLTLPILVALPFTAAFADDVKSGFIKQYLSRTSRGRYIAGKLIACGFSGGLLIFAGVMISFFISALVFTPMELAFVAQEQTVTESAPAASATAETDTVPENALSPAPPLSPSPPLSPPPPPPQTEEQNRENVIDSPAATAPRHWVGVVKKAVTLSFSGMFWSLAGFAFASFTLNRYMAYASPFILYYVLIILHERYFPGLYVLYPKEWLFPENEWVLGNLGVVILITLLTLIISLLFALFAERRLKNV